jgi:hypothetical protein
MSKLSLFDGLEEIAAGAPDENGIPKFEEQKLRRYLKNQKLGSRNKIIFEENEIKFKTCPRYNPCPICDKCMNKASHLYVACQTCQIPICSHTYDDKQKMIKRKNFTIPVNKKVFESIERLDEEITNARYRSNG